MSLLTIGQSVADEIGIAKPTSIANNAEYDKLLRYINKAGIRLMKKVPWEGLRAERLIASVNGETQYGILPSDFDRIIPETFWDRTNAYLIPGPVSPTEWNSLKAASTSGGRKMILRGGNMLIFPLFSGGQVLAFEYITKNWALDSSGTPKASFTADTDTSRIDEELLTLAAKYAYLDSEGLPAGNAFQEFSNYFDMALENDQPDSGVMMSGDIFGGGRHFTGEPGANAGNASGDNTGITWGQSQEIWGS